MWKSTARSTTRADRTGPQCSTTSAVCLGTCRCQAVAPSGGGSRLQQSQALHFLKGKTAMHAGITVTSCRSMHQS